MLRTQNLVAMLAAQTGLDHYEVTLKARRLREAKLFVKETRSPASPRPSPRDIAHLLFMMMSDEPAGYAKATIERAEEMTIDSGSLKHARHYDVLPGHLAEFQREGHSFLDALETLVKCAIESPLEFLEEPGRQFFCTYVEFQRGAFVGEIILDVEAPLLTGFDPDRKIADLILAYGAYGDPRTESAPRSFSRFTRVNAGLFADIGFAANRGSLS
jgi:hypothetical protein